MSAVHSSSRCRVARPAAAGHSPVYGPQVLGRDLRRGATVSDHDAPVSQLLDRSSSSGVVVVVDGKRIAAEAGTLGLRAAHAVRSRTAVTATAANESHRVTRRMPPPVRSFRVRPVSSSLLPRRRQRRRSSVIVASSDSVLSITASAYSAGTPATASRGEDELVAVVHGVHHEVRDGHVHGDADAHDGGDTEVAQDRDRDRSPPIGPMPW